MDLKYKYYEAAKKIIFINKYLMTAYIANMKIILERDECSFFLN